MATFCAFTKEEVNKEEVSRLFTEAMGKLGDWGKAIAAIAISAKGVVLSVWMCPTGEVFKFHVSCYQDKTLFHWAGALKHFSLGFPRGFAVVVDRATATVLALSCFYPKFGNDTPNTSVPDTVERADFYLKYSGSLSLVCFFRHPTLGNCWSVSSKNSADCSADSYPLNMMNVLKGSITESLVEKCIAEGISFATETMLEQDQTHGYGTREGYIATCVHNRDRRFTHSEVSQWCRDNNIVCDQPGTVIGRDAVRRFVNRLNVLRDFITLPTLEAFFREMGVHYDTANHARLVVSNVVEGLVIHFTLSDGSSSMLKFKFAAYQMVTQYLRPLCRGEIVEIDAFLARWVAPANAAHWKRIIEQCRKLCGVACSAELDFEGLWIAVSEFVYCKCPLSIPRDLEERMAQLHVADESKAESTTEAGVVESTTEATVVVVLGPIGMGKSSVGEHLASLHPEYVHIDGDKPSGIEKLGRDRNRYTWGMVLGAIVQGKIPIVSCGGGALWCGPPNANPAVAYLVTHAARCGVKLRFVAVVPSDNSVFEDTATVTDIIRGRQVRGEGSWASLPDSKIDDVCARSRDNRQFVDKFTACADFVATYDRVSWDVERGEAVVGADVNLDGARLFRFTGSVKCNMLYHLYGFDGKLLHRTLHYSTSVESVECPKIETTEDATFVECVSQTGKVLCTFVKLPFSEEAHLTVEPGSYTPASMRTFCAAMGTSCLPNRVYTATGVMQKSGLTSSVTFTVRTRPVKVTPYSLCVLFH